MTDRPYIFRELTLSLCERCLRRVPAKIIEQDGCLYLLKRCSAHGERRALISTDPSYWRQCRQAVKPGQVPLRFNTPIRHGCPYDCGLCPDHEQHSCLTLIEITEQCNLTCPVCYADSSPQRLRHRTMAEIQAMTESLIANEGAPDIVQISGGEPTIHPQFFEILDYLKAQPIRHLMINTNGLRIARETGFAERLAAYGPGLEIYLQWDSLTPDVLRALRGEDLRDARLRALERLNALNLSTTLVVVVQKGLNDHEIGQTLDFALAQRAVRGVTFQPIQRAGRVEGAGDDADARLPLSAVRQAILAQHPLFTPDDLIPVPCHPDAIAMGYALKTPQGPLPLSRFVNPSALFADARNTIVFEQDQGLQLKIQSLFSLNQTPDSCAEGLREMLCCLPKIDAPESLGYDSVFRVIIMEFMDAYNFDVRSVKRACVHIAHPDGRIIPFDTYNLFYRDPAVDVAALAGALEGSL